MNKLTCFSLWPLFLALLLFTPPIVAAQQLDEVSPELKQEIASVEKGLTPAIQLSNDDATRRTLEERMEHYKVPGVSIAVVKDGKLHWAKGYGIANTDTDSRVTNETLFQAGSISKPVAALAALKLVQEGKIDLDENVNNYLKDWKVPDNEFTESEKVTLRRLLTHTAGMTVHGFPGYSQSAEFPTTVQVLDGDGNTAAIRVDTVPGSIWRYSGGGYTVMQKLVEDVSGKSFAEYLHQEILQPLGMKHSTYQQPLPESFHSIASGAYNRRGKLIKGAWHNYPEQAAAGLWTTPTDLAKYCLEMQKILAGQKDGILSRDMVTQMLTKHQNDWGLGPSLSGEGDELVFQHGGKNAGFSNDMFAYANQGIAVIVMTSGDNGIELAGEIMRSIANQYDWQGKTQQFELLEMTEEQLQAMAGTYQTEMDGRTIDIIIEVKEENALQVKIPIQFATKKIVPVGESKFIDLSDGTTLDFQRDGAGQVTGFMINDQIKFTKTK